MPSEDKPSRGCLTCRKRKIRCDRTAGGCRNCTKRRYGCPGYPDESGLVFKSENAVAQTHVERRVATRNRERTPRQTSDSSTTPEAPPIHNEVTAARHEPYGDYTDGNEALQSRSPCPANIDEHAMAYFVSNFVMAGSATEVRPTGSMPAGKATLLQDAMTSAMKAVALASMSTFAKSPHLLLEARKRYSVAVSKTNTALREPELACEDHLLSTVLILNAFETVGGPDASSLSDWSNHAYGATSLVRLRGPKQFDSPVGTALFMSAVSLVTAAVMRDDTPFPSDLLWLAKEARKHVKYHHEYWDFFVIKIEMTEFFSAHATVWPMLQGSLDPDTAVNKALELDEAMAETFEGLSSFFQYATVYVPDLAEYCLDGHCDIYSHFFQAQRWNDMRIHRIILHAIIRHSLKRMDGAGYDGRWDAKARSLQIQKSKKLAFGLQEGILRSVPQHLGMISFGHDGPKKERGQSGRFNFPWNAFKSVIYFPTSDAGPLTQGSPVLRAYGGYALSWALFTASKVEGTDDAVLEKIIRLLKMVGMPQGNHQAAVLAELAKTEESNF